MCRRPRRCTRTATLLPYTTLVLSLDMLASVRCVLTVIGVRSALEVMGLTLFTATLGKLPEYGIVKALGAPPGRLAATVVGQAAWSVALGLLVAVAAAASLGAAIGADRKSGV